MLSNLVDGFLLEYLKRNPYLPNEKTKDYITTKSDLIKVLSEKEILIRNNKDKSLEEIIDLIIADNIKEFEMIRKNMVYLAILPVLKLAIIMLNYMVVILII